MIIYFVISLSLLLCLVFALRAGLALRTLSQEAESDFDDRKLRQMIDPRLTKAQYIRAHKRVHGPRSSVYLAGTFGAIALLTVPLLAALYFILEFGWRVGGQDRKYEPGYLVWQFMLFGGIILGWTLIALFAARHFHKTAPLSLKNELQKELSAQD